MNLKDKFLLVYKSTTTPFYPGLFVARAFSGDFSQILGYKLNQTEMLCLIYNGTTNWIFEKRLKRSAKILMDHLFSGNFYKIINAEKRLSKKILIECKTPIESLFTKKILNEKGEKKLENIGKLNTEYATFLDSPCFMFQIYLFDDFKKEIFKELDISEWKKNNFFNHIISSYKKTNYERYIESILDFLEGKKRLKDIARRFFWLTHDYLGKIIDEDYLKTKITEFKKERNKLKEQINEADIRIKEIKKIKKGLPKKIIKKIELIQEMLFLYNERKKEVLNQSNIFFRKVFEHKFSNISFDKLKLYFQLTPDEIILLLKGKKVKDIEKRNERWGYIMKGYNLSKADEEYFKIISPDNNNKELTGVPASPGKIKGEVNIILNISQIHNFKEGSILVAPFTNINYLPIMSKSKAILTETGGMTSHAAVVSRELKIPCIVGIKNLLLILKDGDLVEVDANKGIVRKLK